MLAKFNTTGLTLAALVLTGTVFASTPLGNAITYQGRLTQDGNLVTGDANMVFFLYDAEIGGNPVGNVNGALPVVDGVFTVDLDFGPDAFNGDARWLEISVDGNTLSPRQPMTAAPYALQTRGIIVDDDGNVGIGATMPATELEVQGTITATAFVGDGSGLTNLPVVDGPWTDNADEIYYDSGSVAIGHTMPVAALDVRGDVVVNVETTVDQVQEDVTDLRTGNIWQSFTAGVDGYLSGIEVRVANSNNATGGTLNLYLGEGTGGQILATQPYSLPTGAQAWVLIPVTDLVSVTNGMQYTMELDAGNNQHLLFAEEGNYEGGIMSGRDDDLAFRTYVSNGAGSGTVMAQAFVGDGSGLSNVAGVWNQHTADLYYDAGNVGIGTTTPETTLHVDGTVTVRSTEAVLDQVNDGAFQSVSSPPNAWQSFTAGATGLLTTFEVYIDSSNQNASGTLSIRTGQGTSGMLLATQPFDGFPVGASEWVAIQLAVPPTVDVGQQYSIVFASSHAFRIRVDDPYAGGQFSGFNNMDMLFRTYVSGSADALIADGTVTAAAFAGDGSQLTNLPITAPAWSENGSGVFYNAGNVGIGTDTPGEELTVVGKIRAAHASDELETIEFNHGGGNANFNWTGDGNLRFRYDGATRVQISQAGLVGIGRNPSTNVLEVAGDASKSIAGAWLANSDRRIKTDIKTVENALDTLDQVRLVSFEYTADYQATHAGVGDRRYLNVIAQEFAQVFPDHVKSSGERLPDGSEILQVDTYPLTIYSAAAIQELRAENRELRAANDALIERLTRLETAVAELTKN